MDAVVSAAVDEARPSAYVKLISAEGHEFYARRAASFSSLGGAGAAAAAVRGPPTDAGAAAATRWQRRLGPKFWSRGFRGGIRLR